MASREQAERARKQDTRDQEERAYDDYYFVSGPLTDPSVVYARSQEYADNIRRDAARDQAAAQERYREHFIIYM